MLIKSADDKNPRLAELEAKMQMGGRDSKYAKENYYAFKAGMKGERDAAYMLDFHYGNATKNWAVIHDLRLEHDGRVAQIDHLLISRFLEIYVLETKHFNSGVKITEEGEFLRWNDFRKTYEGMDSPLAQNERHMSLLREVLKTLPLPERLGVRLQPTLTSYVLISNNARIYRPKAFDTQQVVKVDQLKSKIERELDGISVLKAVSFTAKIVSSETIEKLAKSLAGLHRPHTANPQHSVESIANVSETGTSSATSNVVSVISPQPTIPGPECKACGKGIGNVLYGKFGYYFKCAICDANTNIRFVCHPGHNPRLRKAGAVFYRDCAECKSSEPYHSNKI